MFELVVASGKGGTGKTSLTGALAEVVGPAVLVDCDVDAADLHLVIPHEVQEEHDFSSSYRAVINSNGCNACGVCMESCRFGAIMQTDDPDLQFGVRFSVNPPACEGCNLCVHLCPTQTIHLEKVISGQWYQSECVNGPFFHARLGIAQSNSGRLVSLLRQQAKEVACKNGLDTVIVDGPPGIGCPAIASLTGSSYLLIVTEPSLSAIHDMERLADLANHFEIPVGICLNKFDISNEISEKVERFAADRHLTLHARIPYDQSFTKAQLQGRSYVSCASAEGVGMIRKLWQSIRTDAENREANGGQRLTVLKGASITKEIT